MPPRRGHVRPPASTQSITNDIPPVDEQSTPANFRELPAPSRQSATSAQQMSLDPKSNELYEALLAHPNADGTFTQTDLAALGVASSDQQLLQICQKLVNEDLFQLFILHDTICYKLKSREEASKLQSLDKDSRLIYTAIEAAGSDGIWTKTLKVKTNLHQTVLTKCLRILENNAYIKQIKNPRYPSRKIYMAKNKRPKDEVPGEVWYDDDGEPDDALIEIVSYFIVMYVRSKSWKLGPKFDKPIKEAIRNRELTHMLSSADERNCRILEPYPADYTGFPTTSDILNMLENSGMLKDKHPSKADLEILLNKLVFEDRLHVIKPTAPNPRLYSKLQKQKKHTLDDSDESQGEQPRQKRQKTQNQTQMPDTNDSDSESDGTPENMYRSAFRIGPPPPKPESHVIPAGEDGQAPPKSKEEQEHQDIEDLLKPSHPYGEVPCAWCPYLDECTPGGRINPESCEWMDEWLREK